MLLDGETQRRSHETPAVEVRGPGGGIMNGERGSGWERGSEGEEGDQMGLGNDFAVIISFFYIYGAAPLRGKVRSIQ